VLVFNHVQAICPRVAAMNDDRLLRTPRQRHLVAENTCLHFAGRMIVVIVESDFSPGDDFPMLSQPFQFFQVLRCDFFRLVGMNANRGVNPVMLLGKGKRGTKLLGSRAITNGKQR
jgi:hypothetical protein